MLTSITPLGQRGRGSSTAPLATAYAGSSVLVAGLLGLLLGALGLAVAPSSRPALAVLAAACVVAAVLDAAGRRPPSWRRQVDERWLSTYRGWVTGLGYGGQLGLGVVTIVTSASTYVALLGELLVGRPLVSALVGASFGLARAVPLLLALRVRTPAALARLARGVQRAAQPARLVAAGVVGVVGAASFAGVLG